mgnify:CR=1 FL=1
MCTLRWSITLGDLLRAQYLLAAYDEVGQRFVDRWIEGAWGYCLIGLAAVGVILFLALELIERALLPWHASQRHDVQLGV